MYYPNLINGHFVESDQKITIISPNNLQPVGKVNSLSPDIINNAFRAARTSQRAWKETPLYKRSALWHKFATLLKDNKAKIAQIICEEVGKNIRDAETEVLRTIDYINYTLEEAKRLNPTTYTGDGFGIANKIGIFKREAKGVILVIAPYNYPLNLSISKVVPASIVGNSVVIKPATNGSILGAYIGLLFAEAGFPAGTINVVTGRGSQIGDLLLTHKEVDVIAFTGSVEVGDHIKEIAQGKELILELGGKDPMLVLSDHDLAKVASDIISGGLSYSGQRCTAVKLVLVLEQFADQLVALTKERMQQLKVGVASDPANFITPLIDEATAKFAEEMITEAVANGASIVTGGSRELNLMYPTLVDHVKITMRLGHIEPFAPVIPVIRCQNKTEMIEFANYSMYGLQASVYSNNITEAFQVADLLEVGTVNLNSKSQRGPDSFPFLGVKKSGVGVQGIYDSLLSMTRPKGIVINY